MALDVADDCCLHHFVTIGAADSMNGARSLCDDATRSAVDDKSAGCTYGAVGGAGAPASTSARPPIPPATTRGVPFASTMAPSGLRSATTYDAFSTSTITIACDFA